MAFNYPLLAKSGVSIFPPKTILGVNQYLQSPNGRYRLVNQPDLNLALYDGPNAIWVADRNAPYCHEFYPQVWKKDDASQVYMNQVLGLTDLTRRRIWSTTNTDIPDGNQAAAAERAYLQLQDDGNMVILDLFPRWSNGSSTKLNSQIAASVIEPGTIINPGDTFVVGKSRLIFQGDGNLVFYGENDQVLWASNTHNKGATFAAMQGDGQFAIYRVDGGGTPLWYTGTDGHPGAYGRIQEDGSFSIVTDRICWARFGFVPNVTPNVKRKLVQYGPYSKSWQFDFW
ncbi:putidacin L1 family lectin-like bacteriocin [Pseudomonas putida]